MTARMATAPSLAVLVVGSLMLANQGLIVAQRDPRPIKPAYDDGNVEALPVRGTVHLVAGSGANIVVQVAADGLLVGRHERGHDEREGADRNQDHLR
jgi:hypothetical protein